MFRACALVVVLGSLALCLPAPALACECAATPSVRDALRAAAAVFEGRVTKLTPLGAHDLVVELSVVRTWKGAETEHILLRTAAAPAACGFAFVPDESYLVYADGGPSQADLPGLQVSPCGRTKLTTAATADLTELGIGVVPVAARGNDLPPGTEPPAPAKADNGTTPPRVRPAAGGCGGCNVTCDAQAPHEVLCALLLCALCLRVRLRRRAGHDWPSGISS
jgi:hypothetical protein